MKASDWLSYNQKRVKAKHNGHFTGISGTPSLESRYSFVFTNRVARGVRCSLDFRVCPFLVGK